MSEVATNLFLTSIFSSGTIIFITKIIIIIIIIVTLAKRNTLVAHVLKALYKHCDTPTDTMASITNMYTITNIQNKK